MPTHDWTRLAPGDFHHFHQGWITFLANALNSGVLPQDFMAMAEQVTGRPVPDVVTLLGHRPRGDAGKVVVQTAPPSARVVRRFEKAQYARRADRIAVRHRRGQVVAVIELVSPGNKDSRHALRSFVQKSADLLDQGINLLIVDLFPPTPRDPQGLQKEICDEFGEGPFDLPAGQPLTVGSYQAGDVPTAYIEPVGVGERLPDMPLFLIGDHYVPAPLEASYMETWRAFPAPLKELMDAPAG